MSTQLQEVRSKESTKLAHDLQIYLLCIYNTDIIKEIEIIVKH